MVLAAHHHSRHTCRNRLEAQEGFKKRSELIKTKPPHLPWERARGWGGTCHSVQGGQVYCPKHGPLQVLRA